MVEDLTARQREIVALLAQGLSDRRIAAALGITPRAVRGHVEAVLHRLALADRQELLSWLANRERSG